MPPAPVDFLEALALKQAAADIKLGGRLISVPRARLALHYRLQEISARAAAAGPADVAADYVAAAAGVTMAEIDEGEPADLLAAFYALLDLNRFRGTLAVLWPRDGPARDGAGPEDYPNRSLASLVATLAHAYGWSADHILGLGPEEAVCYLQEAVVLAHEDREQQWRLAGGGVDKDGHKVKFPAIAWGRQPGAPKRRGPPPVPDRIRPKGVIVELEDEAEKGRRPSER